jgi:VanZ family protein
MKTLKLWIPSLTIAAVITMLSHIAPSAHSAPVGLPSFMPSDDAGHLLLYFLLGIVVARQICAGGTCAVTRVVAASTIACLAFGFADELHQTFVQGRSAEFSDLMVDVWGGAVGATMSVACIRINRAIPQLRRSFLLRSSAMVCLACTALFVGVAPHAISHAARTYPGMASDGRDTASGPSSVLAPSSQVSEDGSGREARDTERTDSPRALHITADLSSVHKGAGPNRIASRRGVTLDLSVSEPDAANEHDTRPAGRSPQSEDHNRASVRGEPNHPNVIDTATTPTDTRKTSNKRTDHLNYIRKFSEALAEAEADHAEMIMLSKNFPRKILQARKIDCLKKKIAELKRDRPHGQVDETTCEYLSQLKIRLAELEIRDIEMIAFSKRFPRRLVLRKKIEVLKNRIAQVDPSRTVRVADGIMNDDSERADERIEPNPEREQEPVGSQEGPKRLTQALRSFTD